MNWPVRRIGDLCTVGRGSSPRPKNDMRYFENGEIPWIKVADATASGKYLYETKEKVNPFGASFSRLLKAGSIIRTAAKLLGGGGGGRPELAQGGGPNAEKLDEALAAGKGAMRAG